MAEENYVAASEFCSVHNLGSSLIRTLVEYGLIETITIDNSPFIRESQLAKLQQIARLHHELDINIEGIYAIMHLLQKIRILQNEISALKNRMTSVHHNGL